MGSTYNIYCDESCHLMHDKKNRGAMVLGALICPNEKKDEVFKRIKEIKEKYKLSPKFEIKWTKVSSSKVDFYKELIDYFFDNNDLKFRAIVADLNKVDHKKFNQTHDEWYYAMYYRLLDKLIDDKNKYKIFLDIKDTKGFIKEKKLQECLCNHNRDFKQNLIAIQSVRSNQVQLIQLTDLLIGAVSYKNRNIEKTNKGKLNLIKRIEERSELDTTKTNYNSKFNLFFWEGR